MQILFITSILSFCILVWAGVAIVRHIHANQKSSESSSVQGGIAPQTQNMATQAAPPMLAENENNQARPGDQVTS
jgi:hypothetical protein